MHDLIKFWLANLYRNEINEVKKSINNEHIWELGDVDSELSNKHTENIKVLEEYIHILEEKYNELDIDM